MTLATPVMKVGILFLLKSRKRENMNTLTKSTEFFNKAQKLMPGGVNSPVRAYRAVGGIPPFIAKAKGSKIWDVDKNEYIDFVCSWGPLILGHSHPAVIYAIKEQAEKGTSYGAPTELEVEMAELLIDALPAVQMVRMVNSGTEATMSAIRLARGYTNKNKIIKFTGCYHGHADMLLTAAGSGVATLDLPDCKGVPLNTAQNTITLPFNNLEKVGDAFEKFGDDIAGVIVEPVAGNMGVVLPKIEFLNGLRDITYKYESLLIFDEVITGFRVSYNGAQGYYDIMPDLTCLGKIIGGGLPVGAYGGRKEIMKHIAPTGPVYQAGTLSGNPLAMAAGIAAIKELQKPDVYKNLEQKRKNLSDGLKQIAEKAGIPIFLTGIASMSSMFFTDKEVTDFTTAKTSNTKRFSVFFHEMLKNGIYLAPSQFEATFVSTAHTDEDIDKALNAAEKAFKFLF